MVLAASYFNLPTLWAALKDNIIFFLQFILIIALIALVALFAQLLIRKQNEKKALASGQTVEKKILSSRMIAVTGVLAAIAGVLMLFELPLFFAPSFYKIDLSELPVLICSFAYGPVAGVLCEAVKILVKLVIKGTSTAFVGELANFVVGCALIVPTSIVYHIKKNRKTALIGCIVGTAFITVVGTLFNAVYLLPKFAELYGMDISVLIGMGTEVNSHVKDIPTFVILCVAPLNILKGTVVSVITMFIYKPLRHVIK